MAKLVQSHQQLEVYKLAFATTMGLFELSKRFPKEEMYALTDQMRRSSRSVCANIAEAWRKRRYIGSFISKLSDAETEAAETQVWLEFAVSSKYVDRSTALPLYRRHDDVTRTLVGMITHADEWALPQRR